MRLSFKKLLIICFYVFSFTNLFGLSIDVEGWPIDSGFTSGREIYGEYRLWELLNQKDKEGTVFKLMPDSNNEFVITGNLSNNPNIEKDGVVFIFEGFKNCKFVMHNPDMKIIFRQTSPLSGGANKVLFRLKNNENTTFDGLKIFVDLNNGSYAHGSRYNEGLIDLEEGNKNIFFRNNTISGALGLEADAEITGNFNSVKDMYISGGISVGRSEHYMIDEKTPEYKKVNKNIYFTENKINFFRVFGLTMKGADNINIIDDNEISHIWEKSDTFLSKAGGIHLVYSSDITIKNNNIHDVYSLFDFNNAVDKNVLNTYGKTYDEDDNGELDEKWREIFQHGIYVSGPVTNILIENNDIKYVSGQGIAVSANRKKGRLSQNVVIHKNRIKFAMNSAVGASGVVGLKITNNSFAHCGHRLDFDGFPFKYDLGVMQGSGVVTLKDRADTADNKKILDLTFNNNVITSRHFQFFDKKNKFKFFYATASYSLYKELSNSAKNYNNIIRIDKYPEGNGNIYGYLIKEYENNEYFCDKHGNCPYDGSPEIDGTLNGHSELKKFIEYTPNLVYINYYDSLEDNTEHPFLNNFKENFLNTAPSGRWNYSQFNYTNHSFYYNMTDSEPYDFVGLFRIQYIKLDESISNH